MKTRYGKTRYHVFKPTLGTDLVRRPKHTWCPAIAPPSPCWQNPGGLHSPVLSALASLSLGSRPSCFPAKAGLALES